jgi:hypothetical protein
MSFNKSYVENWYNMLQTESDSACEHKDKTCVGNMLTTNRSGINHITNTNHFNQMQQSQRRELNKLMSLRHSYMNALSILGIALTKEQQLGKKLAEQRMNRATYNYQ